MATVAVSNCDFSLKEVICRYESSPFFFYCESELVQCWSWMNVSFQRLQKTLTPCQPPLLTGNMSVKYYKLNTYW